MISLEQVVTFVAARYRWGLHPLKLIVALLLPTVCVWIADRRVRQQSATLAEHEATPRHLPRTRRR